MVVMPILDELLSIVDFCAWIVGNELALTI